MLVRYRCAIALCVPILAALGAPSARTASAAPVLTGAGLFAADEAGNWGGLHLWNTVSDGFYWNLFLTDSGDPAGGSFLNGPTDAEIAPAIPLTPGTHSFGLLGLQPQPGSGFETGFAGLNLYFNDGAAPAISLVAPTGPAAGALSPAAGQVPGPVGEFITGAGALSYSDGQSTVTVTSFQWDTNPAFPLDRVGGFTAGPSGSPNLHGRMTLSVTAVPEPASALGLALVALAAMSRRRS
jgi:hypothetical protein